MERPLVGPVNIMVAGGTYNEIIEMDDPADGGEEGAPVSWIPWNATDNDTVIVSSGLSVTNWQKSSLMDNLWVAKLSSDVEYFRFFILVLLTNMDQLKLGSFSLMEKGSSLQGRM